MARFCLNHVQLFQAKSARKTLVDIHAELSEKKRKGDYAIGMLHLQAAIHNLDEFMTLADKRPAQAEPQTPPPTGELPLS